MVQAIDSATPSAAFPIAVLRYSQVVGGGPNHWKQKLLKKRALRFFSGIMILIYPWSINMIMISIDYGYKKMRGIMIHPFESCPFLSPTRVSFPNRCCVQRSRAKPQRCTTSQTAWEVRPVVWSQSVCKCFTRVSTIGSQAPLGELLATGTIQTEGSQRQSCRTSPSALMFLQWPKKSGWFRVVTMMICDEF